MLDGEDTDPEDDERLTQIFDWINLVFRSFTYALFSGWIDDKQDDYQINITMNVITWESSQETTGTGTGMIIPKKYRRATKPT